LEDLVRQVAARRIEEGASAIWLVTTTAERELQSIAQRLGFVRHAVGATPAAGQGAEQPA
jgi:hypothetical protein